MKKIVFLTLYDPICLGVRLLSSIAKEKGFDSRIIIFKRDAHNKPILRGSKDNVYTYFHEGILRGSILQIAPPTSSEKNLVVKLIKDINPDILCLSTRSFGYELSKEIMFEIKKNINIPIITGGWGPTMEPEKFLEFADYVCFGEGENTLTAILDAVDKGISFKNIKNLIYIKDNQLVRNDLYEPLTQVQLTELPLPDYDINTMHLISEDKILNGKEFYNNKIYDCFAGRGCPMSCSYCMSSKYKELYKQYGHNCPKYRLRQVDIVIEELIKAKQRGAIYIRFKDEVFPFNKKWVREFIKQYKEKINLPFFAYIRPEFHSNSVIGELVESGLTNTLVGIQSGSEYILNDVFNRHLKKETAIRFANLLDNHNVRYIYHLISHNPFEKEEHLRETLNFTYNLPFAPMHVFKLVVFPNSPIERRINRLRPSLLQTYIYDWYSLLFCLSTQGPFGRKLSKFIFSKSLFKRHPYIIQLYFIPTLIKEYYNRIKYSFKYKTSGSLSVAFKNK